ncbi:MAG: hypothetical protein AAFX06_27780 [Planctomycetota bacterium]
MALHSQSTTTQPRFSVGQWVYVRPAAEIESTLDGEQCLEGMPFMPEMRRFCGKRFRIERWATNVCLQGVAVRFSTLDDCLILDTPRCNGEHHGGCQMGCRFFWKSRWLDADGSSVSESQDEEPIIPPVPVALLGESDEYRCQATQLGLAVRKQTTARVERLRTEHHLNGLAIGSLASGLCTTLLARFRGQHAGLRGPCRRTPVTDLGLRVGEEVVVRVRSEIVATLDRNGKNRGLWFDPMMLRFCGATLAVSRRMSRFICERTGRMIELSVPSVVLDDLHCDGQTRQFCSRGLHFFWRECWLRRP